MSKGFKNYTIQEIRGRSGRICQNHFDIRAMKIKSEIIYTDEIVNKEDCNFCEFNK